MMARRMTLVVFALLVVQPVFALDVPPLERRVTDLAGLFSLEAASEMDYRLQILEEETGAQVAVLAIPNLEGQALEDFSMRVVEAWKLGGRDRDNGVLVLIARDDRKIRIEVGYGLEGVLPDILCGRIIDNAMKPAFRQGDFSGGTVRAVELIDGLVRADPEAAHALNEGSGGSTDTMPLVAMGAIFLSVVGVFAMSALFTKGGGAWFLYLFLMPFFFAFPGAAFGGKVGVIVVLVWLIGFPILRTLIWHTGAGKDFRTSHPTWTTWSSSGGSWSSGSGGWSSGGGGFSGGGGSFGGGGASGGW
jgi:uncharacterized protein